ncbi:uncharacterized protein LOC5571977 [Aedes aegypti]|uniref:Fanconi anemia group M protein n=1 Tax=Aedes aegypti TaxID=7159 RepID=A0A6I8TZX8_AEDAE|nr:uncharacterized protein LOC5571977 [Aedes aegypti]
MNESGSANESAGTSRGFLNATSYSLNDSEMLDCDEGVLQLMDKPFSQLVDGMQLRKNDRYAGFDNNAGSSWIYPTNYPVRKYQYSIVQAALFKNTLVVLPTGLGKTFIAAVVMYNLYRWYPTGKVIFMAPTRPLVNQQIEACYKIMGIPKEDTAEMTGKQQRKNRTGLWQSKRVFYVTPQVVLADINSPEQNFPINEVKLVVVDEAHKAKGRYAYTEVIKAIASTNRNFRVLALSATPGRTLEDVAEVIKNLLISHIEVRWENSIDVSPYTFKKNIRTVVIPLGPNLSRIREHYLQILDPYVRRLLDANVISGHVGSLSRGWLIMEQKRFRETNLIQRHPNYTAINSDFITCVSMYHALELLVRHGVRAFLNFFEDEHNRTEEKYFVAKDPRLKAFLDELREEYGRNPLAIFGGDPATANGMVGQPKEEVTDFGHPKFAILERNLKEHFQNNPDSKVIIFCEYRESVAMIQRLLLQNRPLIKPKCIVGQGGTAGGLRAVTQKEQIAAMKDFRSGACNTLIATCVAEEGIDVGEVDLIVCFDIAKNPTRFVQRIGRTGRQRVGRVLMLVTEGKEHDTLKEVMASKDKTNQKLSRSKEILGILYRQSPRLVPTEFDPKCVETFIKIPTEAEEEVKSKKGRKRKNDDNQVEEATAEVVEEQETRKRRKKAEAPRGTQDVRKFFRKVDTDLDATEREVFSSPQKKEDVSVNSLDTSRGSFRAPQDASLRLGKTDQEQELEKIIKPLLRHKARLHREQFLNDRKEVKLREEKVFKSILCSNPLKKIFLEANLGYLREAIEKSEILHAAASDHEEDDLIVLDDRGDCLKSEIKSIENLFDGRTLLKGRVSEIEEYSAAVDRLRPRQRLKPVELPKVSDDQVAQFNEIFSRFSGHSLKANVLHHLPDPELPNSPPPLNVPYDPTTSNLFDSPAFLPPLQDPEGSRYLPNPTDPPEPPPPPDDETPVNRHKAKSRTAQLTKSEKQRTPADYSNSPLLRAFNRSIQKAKNSDYASPLTSRPNFRMVLEYFGLGHLDQMFEESSDEPPPPPPPATCGKKFLDRLQTVAEEEEPAPVETSLTQQIAELSKSLFDLKELEMQAQEAAFLAGDFDRSSKTPKAITASEEKKDLTSKELEMIDADFMEGDFSAVERLNSSSKKTQIPIDDFLRDHFPEDKTQAVPCSTTSVCSTRSSELFPLSSTTRQKKELELDIHGCLEDLVDGSESEEAVPNSQEPPPPANPKSQARPSQLKNLVVGNLEDLLADSDDDLFKNSCASKKSADNSDHTVDYDFKDAFVSAASQKENIPVGSLPTTPKAHRKPESKPQTSPQVVERSPSLLRKKLNFTRLRLSRTNDTGTLEVNSAPLMRNQSGTSHQQSPFFASCRPGGEGVEASRDEASSFRQELERKFGFKQPQQQDHLEASQQEMSMIAPRSKRKAIVSSESEGEEAAEIAKREESDEDSDVFQTARSNAKSSSELMGPPPAVFRRPEKKRTSPKFQRPAKRRKRKERPDFFLSQASVSDDDDDGEDEEEDDYGLSQFVDDSIIHHGPVEEDDADDMRAKYLQSVRSPIRRPGGFKIPAAPSRFINTLDIYSQPAERRHLQQSMYEMNSFIASEEEDEDLEGSDVSDGEGRLPSSQSTPELDELEQAEAILRERRRARRLQKQLPKAKRRRKIVSLSDGEGSSSSGDEGEELKAFRRAIHSELPSN